MSKEDSAVEILVEAYHSNEGEDDINIVVMNEIDTLNVVEEDEAFGTQLFEYFSISV